MDQTSALVALFHVLHMAAKSSRAAVADRREGLSLFGVENMSPPCEELFFVGAEDIAATSGRWVALHLRLDQIDCAERFERASGRANSRIADLQITGRWSSRPRDPAVSWITTRLTPSSRRCVAAQSVPQRVRMNGLGGAGQLRCLSADPENGLGCERATHLPAFARKKPVRADASGATGTISNVRGSGIREHDLSVFAALATANPDHAATTIEIGYPQSGNFRYPEPGTVKRGQNRPVVPGSLVPSAVP